MLREEQRNRMICDKCRNVFNIKDAAVKYRTYGGVSIREKRCPECGGTFHAIDLPDDLDKFLFVNNNQNYYIYNKDEN